jgi:voltage-gated potassium channel
MDVAPEYRMEEIEVAPGCAGQGKPIADVRGGAIIVGVRFADGKFQPQPPAETVLDAGDVVMAMGTLRTMQRLEALFAPARAESRS